MAHIVSPQVEEYLATLGKGGSKDPILGEMESIAAERDFPIVGPQVGRLLAILGRFAGARRVLELGSGFGYSAYWFARALVPGGVVHCTDLSTENKTLAEKLFRKAGLAERLVFHVGDALTIAREQRGPFDIVFNDIDKAAYPESIEIALKLVRTGGLFITDNTLWDGKVAEPRAPDATTAAIVRFNEVLFSRRDLDTVIIPLRDGVTVCQKK